MELGASEMTLRSRVRAAATTGSHSGPDGSHQSHAEHRTRTEDDMVQNNLGGLKVAILVTDGFEQVEMTEPRRALDEAGATTRIVSPKHGHVRAWNFTDWSIELTVDADFDQAHAA